MRYNRLGQSGLVVSELCLGAMTFGNQPSGFFQHDLDQDGSTALVRQALDARGHYNRHRQHLQPPGRRGVSSATPCARSAWGRPRSSSPEGHGAGGEGPTMPAATRYTCCTSRRSSPVGPRPRRPLPDSRVGPELRQEEALRAREWAARVRRATSVCQWAAWQIAQGSASAKARMGQVRLGPGLYTAANRQSSGLVTMMRSEGLGVMVVEARSPADCCRANRTRRGRQGRCARVTGERPPRQ